MRSIIQISALILMFVLGVFLGVDSAEDNIHKMQGTEGATRAIQITPQDGKIEISVLGQVVKTENPVKEIDQKKIVEVTEKVKSESNRLAVIGNEVGSGIQDMARGIVDCFISLRK